MEISYLWLFSLPSFLADSAQAIVTKIITTKKKPNHSVKELKRKSKISKESVPSNNRARAARINSRTSFFKIYPDFRGVERPSIPKEGLVYSKILIPKDLGLADKAFVPSQN